MIKTKKHYFFSPGFTFVEAMVSMLILTFGLLLFLQLFPLGYSAERSSQMKTQAIFLAQEKVEEIMASPYQNVALGTITESGLPSPFQLFSRQTSITLVKADLTESASDVGLKKIRVVVSWQAGLKLLPKQVELMTLIINQ